MPEKKYLEEIEEILKRSEVGEAKRPTRRTRKLPSARLPSLQITQAVSPGKLMVAGVVALVLAMALRPFLSWLTAPLIWAGLGMFVLAYVLFLVRPRMPQYEKRWRGRPVEEEPASLWERIRRGLRGL